MKLYCYQKMRAASDFAESSLRLSYQFVFTQDTQAALRSIIVKILTRISRNTHAGR